MVRKEQLELMTLHRALLKLRLLAADVMRDSNGLAHEALKQIYHIADAFHEVPNEIARGARLDPALFALLAAEAGVPAFPECLALQTLNPRSRQ